MRDKRGGIRINTAAMKRWMLNQYNVYARDVVSIGGRDLPLVLSVSMKGNYIVSLGNDILYNGKDIIESTRLFNYDIKRLRILWANIKPSQKDQVKLPDTDKEQESI